jgi:hypothetical protein
MEPVVPAIPVCYGAGKKGGFMDQFFLLLKAESFHFLETVAIDRIPSPWV